jgi:hypothetical protein
MRNTTVTVSPEDSGRKAALGLVGLTPVYHLVTLGCPLRQELLVDVVALRSTFWGRTGGRPEFSASDMLSSEEPSIDRPGARTDHRQCAAKDRQNN